MYELGDAVDGVSVDPGTNLLISGPAMAGKHDLALDVLAGGIEDGDGAIVVTTSDAADRVLDDVGNRVSVADAVVGIVDCVSRQQGHTPVEGELVRYASSPVDLTGIGIELSDLLEHVYRERGLERNRILLDSLSTLLMYSDIQTVFRFLHVFTGRVQSADALGLFILDSTAHDEQDISTLKQLFDGVVEVREEEGGRRLRPIGLPGIEPEWTSF